jgi:hypothetical protein
MTLKAKMPVQRSTSFQSSFIMQWMDILRAYDATVDTGRQTLSLAEEEVSLWSPGEGPRPSGLVVAKDQVISAQCEGIMMARLESPLGVESGLAELSPQTCPPQGLYIARTVVQDRREVPVRVLNTTHRDQKLARGSLLAHCEPVTLVTPPDLDHRQAPVSSSKVQEGIEAAKSNLSDGEFQELEDLTT